MQGNIRVFAGKAAALLAAPVLIWAFSSGPPAKHTGAPGEQNCTACHAGTAVNAGGGNISIAFADGSTTFNPGETKRVRVTVTDSAAARWGFQASPRLASDTTKPAGTLQSGAGTQVICGDDRDRPTAGCPTTEPLEFIEHSSPATSGVFEFDWKAPDTAGADVIFYAAGNAANNNRAATGDRIYTANVRLSAAAVSGNRPAIGNNGVVNGASFLASGTGGSISPGSWISIFGTNLAANSRDWTGLINNNVFPTAIDGVRVNINGKPAAIWVVSPTQLNVQVPDDNAVGPVQVEVINNNGTSTATADMRQAAPAFFMFDPDNRKYVAAQFPNSGGKAVGRRGLFSGRESEPAESEQIIEIYGTGFGPTNPAQPSGRIVGVARTTNDCRVTIGNVNAPVEFCGIVGAGLYQINVRIPSGLTGDQPIVATVGGARTQDNAFITLK